MILITRMMIHSWWICIEFPISEWRLEKKWHFTVWKYRISRLGNCTRVWEQWISFTTASEKPKLQQCRRRLGIHSLVVSSSKCTDARCEITTCVSVPFRYQSCSVDILKICTSWIDWHPLHSYHMRWLIVSHVVHLCSAYETPDVWYVSVICEMYRMRVAHASVSYVSVACEWIACEILWPPCCRLCVTLWPSPSPFHPS